VHREKRADERPDERREAPDPGKEGLDLRALLERVDVPETVIAIGMSPAAPNPWIARAAISCGIERAKAQVIAPARKIAIATSKRRRRPWMSARRP